MERNKALNVLLLPQPAQRSEDWKNTASPTAVSYVFEASSKAPSLSDLVLGIRERLREELLVDSYWLPEYQCYGNKVPILADESLTEALSYFKEQQLQQQQAVAAGPYPAAPAAAYCELYLWPTAAEPPWTLADYFAAKGKQLGFKTNPEVPVQGLLHHDPSAGLNPATTVPCDNDITSHRNDSSSSGSTAATAAPVHSSGTIVQQQQQEFDVEGSIAGNVQQLQPAGQPAVVHHSQLFSSNLSSPSGQTTTAAPPPAAAAAAAAGLVATALLPIQTSAGLLLLPVAYQQPAAAAAAARLGKRSLAAALPDHQQQQQEHRRLRPQQPNLNSMATASGVLGAATAAAVGHTLPCISSVSNSSSDSLEMLQLDLAPSIGQTTTAAAAAVDMSPAFGSSQQQQQQQQRGLTWGSVSPVTAAEVPTAVAALPNAAAAAAAKTAATGRNVVTSEDADAFDDLYNVLAEMDPDCCDHTTDLIQGCDDDDDKIFTPQQQQQHDKDTLAVIHSKSNGHALDQTLDADLDLAAGFLSDHDHSDCPEFDHSDLGCDLKDIWQHWRWE